MVDGRSLCGTLTLTEYNNTDNYVVYDMDVDNTVFVDNGGGDAYLDFYVANTFNSPLVSSDSLSTAGFVCVSLDLFKCKDTVSPNTPTGGVVVATDDANQPKAISNIVVTADTTTMTGTTYVQTKTESSLTTSDPDWIVVPQSNARGVIVEYVISRTDSQGYRTGQIMAVWNGTSVQFTDTSTRDVGASTAGCIIKITGTAGNDGYIGLDITSGTYTVTAYVRALGTYI
jgi:hypothetical protein